MDDNITAMKDPAFLFYSSDFLTGTMMFTNEQTGKYIRLLCLQHQKGKLTEEEMLFICVNKDDKIFSKFIFEDGYYYNKRLQEESEKRNKYCLSRKSNRDKSDNNNTHIYFIHDKITNNVKIGSSVNPKRRIVELENENNDLELLFFTEKTSQKLETELHKQYSDYNISLEWYNIYNKLDKIIKKLTDKNIKLHMITHMYKHMENENEDINVDELVFIKKEYIEIFKRWLLYKKSKRQKYKSLDSLETCYNKLIKYSKDNPVIAAEIIDDAIGNNYDGFFKPKQTNNNGPIKLKSDSPEPNSAYQGHSFHSQS